MKITNPQQDKSHDAWQAADCGCDGEWLQEHLGMSPAERVRAHASALALAEKLHLTMAEVKW